jgi:hypothetical protein
MPRVGFEPTIPVFERAKTVHATVIGTIMLSGPVNTRIREIKNLFLCTSSLAHRFRMVNRVQFRNVTKSIWSLACSYSPSNQPNLWCVSENGFIYPANQGTLNVHVTRMSITMLTKACHWTICCIS